MGKVMGAAKSKQLKAAWLMEKKKKPSSAHCGELLRLNK